MKINFANTPVCIIFQRFQNTGTILQVLPYKRTLETLRHKLLLKRWK